MYNANPIVENMVTGIVTYTGVLSNICISMHNVNEKMPYLGAFNANMANIDPNTPGSTKSNILIIKGGSTPKITLPANTANVPASTLVTIEPAIAKVLTCSAFF